MTDEPTPRENPLAWDDEGPSGVLSPFEGSDVAGPDALLKTLGLPSGEGMIRDRAVSADAQAGPAVRETLAKVAGALRAAAEDGRAWRMRLDHLNDNDLAVLFDALGEGEVSVVLSGGAPGEGEAQIQETVLAGVWVGRAMDDAGSLRAQWIEVADAPKALREAAEARPRDDLALEALAAPREAMNVMGVLSEVRARALDWRPQTPNHVINFTLFPMNDADVSFLSKVLGEVGVRVASGGYGVARVVMTALKRVWAVQYLNGMGTVILDTLEVGDVPDAVLAGPTDFADSARRLAAIAEAYDADVSGGGTA